MLDNQADIAGLICESFAYRVPAPDFALAVLKGLSHLAPHAHVLKLPKKEFSRDPKVVQALIDDPLLANEVQPTKTVAEMVRADERLKRDFKLFTLPVLIIHGTKDTVTRPEGSQEFYRERRLEGQDAEAVRRLLPRPAERHRQGSGHDRHPHLDRRSTSTGWTADAGQSHPVAYSTCVRQSAAMARLTTSATTMTPRHARLANISGCLLGMTPWRP